MAAIQLLALGNVEGSLLSSLRQGLESELDVSCAILPERFDPEFAFHAERAQYHATEILHRLQARFHAGGQQVLGVTGVDLYIPILTFVFGEALVHNSCAVVSFHRLRQQFYGLPADSALLDQRLLKETMHELGHGLGLMHCEDYRCAMAPSHAVEWIDLKGSALCDGCRARIPTLR